MTKKSTTFVRLLFVLLNEKKFENTKFKRIDNKYVAATFPETNDFNFSRIFSDIRNVWHRLSTSWTRNNDIHFAILHWIICKLCWLAWSLSGKFFYLQMELSFCSFSFYSKEKDDGNKTIRLRMLRMQNTRINSSFSISEIVSDNSRYEQGKHST